MSQGVESGKDTVDTTVKGILTPQPYVPPPKGGFLETFVSPETTLGSTKKLVKKTKKEAKKELMKGEWISQTEKMMGNRENELGATVIKLSRA